MEDLKHTATDVWRRQNLPAYIPSRNFAAAVLDLAVRPEDRDGEPPPPLTVDALRLTVSKMDDTSPIKPLLRTALDGVEKDVGEVRKNLEAWYNASMDRVSGWYKRRTQLILFGLGLLTAAMFNIDTVWVAGRLSTDKAYRQAVVAQAGTIVARSAAPRDGEAASLPERFGALRTELEATGALMGWWPPQLAGCGSPADPCIWHVGQMLLGWLATALAVTLGAPFWFDVLNKFIVIRSTVKPSEKSRPEASKDRQT